jgi:hypothetical protein
MGVTPFGKWKSGVGSSKMGSLRRRRVSPNPLEALSWQDLRDEIYGGQG